MKEFDVVIGLEVHVQLGTNSKIFCSCSTKFENPVNTNICPVCCGYPGVLPVFNQKTLALAVRVALCLNCKINQRIYFERKNYFYPDLPKNYQISQYKMPLGEEGELEVTSENKIRIKRVHLEEDAGKLIHKENYSLVDFNRTGVPLLEIVSYPDISSPGEAFEYLNCLKLSLQYIGASDCDMEKGSLRCDANISLKRKEATRLGTKVELKNMNTFRGVRDALTYEIGRQAEVLGKGEKVLQETRLWDGQKKNTVIMRIKEEAHDYRYFPEPDLLDFFIPQEVIDKERGFIGESPLEKRQRFLSEYDVSLAEADVLISYRWLADFFEAACREYNKPKEISNWLLGPFLEQINILADGFEGAKISPRNFSQLVKYFCEGKLNNLAAKKVLSLSISTDRDTDEIIEAENLLQVSGEDALMEFIKEAIVQNTKPVDEYRQGKDKAIMFLVGQVMRKSGGTANPKVVRELLEKTIKSNK